jgi:hypothetical protein
VEYKMGDGNPDLLPENGVRSWPLVRSFGYGRLLEYFAVVRAKE